MLAAARAYLVVLWRNLVVHSHVMSAFNDVLAKRFTSDPCLTMYRILARPSHLG